VLRHETFCNAEINAAKPHSQNEHGSIRYPQMWAEELEQCQVKEIGPGGVNWKKSL